MQTVSARNVQDMLADGGELALIDVREELVFSQGHLLWARSIPLSRLELDFARLVPRRSTRIVLCDDDDGLALRASRILAQAGYRDVSALAGGVSAWAERDGELFSGVNVASKAFGEFVEHQNRTPSISASELNDLIRAGTDMVVLDARPFDEYQAVSIPTAINVPGAELVLRIRDLTPSPDTLVVVNCAGRTRSIIGAQSLINAGVTNRVVALRNGTMGFIIAGIACEHGQERRAPAPSRDGLAWAQAAAQRVARRLAIERIDRATLERWRAEADTRTLYLLDVRDPADYAAGHIAGAISAPGGQLVQATDQYVGTLGARIVLCDDDGVRATMTASWLRQMGWRDLFVLTECGRDTAAPMTEILGTPAPPELAIDCAMLADLVTRDDATVVDLSPSRTYRAGHIPGSWFAIRSRLERAFGTIPVRGTLVLTSEDGVLASRAVADARALTSLPVRCLAGGNAAWRAAGQPFSHALRMADEPVDAWVKPYQRDGDTLAAMNEYLVWETTLLASIERDASCRFAVLPQNGRTPPTLA